MPKDVYIKASELKFEQTAFQSMDLTGPTDTLPGAVGFYHDQGVYIDAATQLFSGDLKVLFETNMLRNECDPDEKRTIMGDDSVTVLVRWSKQPDGTYYITGELMAHEGDANRRRVYIQKLLTDVLHEVSEPLRSALDTLKASSIADLAPMAYDYLKA